MKRIFGFILLILVAGTAMAQNFTVHFDNLNGTALINGEVVMTGMVTNNSETDTLNLLFIRDSVSTPEFWSTSLCFEECAAPWIDSLGTQIAPLDSQHVSFHFWTDNMPAYGMAWIRFQDADGWMSELFMLYAETVLSGIEEAAQTPVQFALYPNYPNPFNNETMIRFAAPSAGTADLAVFDITGRRIRSLNHDIASAGETRMHWDGKNSSGQDAPSGIYFYRLNFRTSGGEISRAVQKMTLLR